MTYSPRPNASGDNLVSSRDPIRTNFEVIQNRFEDNHEEFSAGTGKHTRMDLVEQTVFPATAVNESWASSREYTSGGVGRTELAYRPESTAAGGDQFILSAMPVRCALLFAYDGVSGGAQTPLGRSFNVASIASITSLEFVITFDNAIPSEDYLVIPSMTTSSSTKQVYPSPLGKLTTSFTFRSNSALLAGNLVNILILGG